MLLDTSQPTLFENQQPYSSKDLINYDDLCNSFSDSYAPYIIIHKNLFEQKKVITQNIGKINLEHRQKHIHGEQMTGGRGKWYPVFSVFDIDTKNIKVSPETVVQGIKESLDLNESQYILNGSLSYYETGNLHMYIRPEWNGKTEYLKKTRNRLLPVAREYGVELYPQTWRKICEPCSPFQPVLDDSLQPIQQDWQETVKQYNSIEPIDISQITGQGFLEFHNTYYTGTATANYMYFPTPEKAQQLIEHGLQSRGTRHNSILDLACFYSVQENVLPGQAERMIYKWITEKHNGMSKDINSGKMTPERLRNEVRDCVEWAYKKYMRNDVLPTPVHNIGYGIADSHIDFIADVFPGDLVNQRRLFRLLCFYNPRSHWQWVYIHHNIWFYIAGSNYKKFQEILKSKGILAEPKHNIYIPGSQSKRFKLLNIRQDKSYICYDKRNITSFDGTLQVKGIEYLKNRLKLNRMSIYRINNLKTNNMTLNEFIN